MSDINDTNYDSLTDSEKMALRHQSQWSGPFKRQAAKAEAALLVHRLSGAVNRLSSGQDESDFPPFNGLAASLFCAPPATDAASHETNGDLAGVENIGTQSLRGLNVAARSEIVDAASSEALAQWQKSRHKFLQQPAPWSVITTPKIPLIGDTAHPFAPEGSGERLMPHSTAFSQTLYLAIRSRIATVRDFVKKDHPEWLNEKGEISPFSVLNTDKELSDLEMLERERILAELTFVRDLKEQGLLYLEHARPEGRFFDFKGAGERFLFVPKNGYEWDRASKEQALRWQRIQGRSPNLTYSGGRFDPVNATSKAQVLCLMASYAGFPMEEGVYRDESKSKKEHRFAVFVNTRWASQERLMLLEQLIARYQSLGLTQDTQAYQKALMKKGCSDDEAAKRALDEFEKPAIAGIEQSMSVLESLADHHFRQPSIDIGEAYISLLDSSTTDLRTPITTPLGLQRFGLSVDPSKVNEHVMTDIGATLGRHKPWMLNRGYQPRTFDVMNKIISDQGYLGLNVHSDALFQKGASLYSRERETEHMLKMLKQSITAQNSSVREKEVQAALQGANDRIEVLRASLIKMREKLKSTLSRNEDLEHALAVSEDLYVATNIGALELVAEQEGMRLPPICEVSRAAQWMAKKGFEVPEHHRFIRGKSGGQKGGSVTLKEALELTNQSNQSGQKMLADFFGDYGIEEGPSSSSPTFI